jgi:hypothetical protein
LRCGVNRRTFLQFCSSLMVAAPFGLPITDKKTPEEVAHGLGKAIRPPVKRRVAQEQPNFWWTSPYGTSRSDKISDGFFSETRGQCWTESRGQCRSET